MAWSDEARAAALEARKKSAHHQQLTGTHQSTGSHTADQALAGKRFDPQAAGSSFYDQRDQTVGQSRDMRAYEQRAAAQEQRMQQQGQVQRQQALVERLHSLRASGGQAAVDAYMRQRAEKARAKRGG